MPLYECVLIARNDVTQQQVEGLADEIAGQLETDGGAVKKREYWGLRGLSYRIKKNRKGHYMLLGLDAKPAFVTEMERQLRLNEDIIRFMTIRVDEIEEAQSAILARKSDEAARVYVKGVRVATEDQFLFSYDITSTTAQLQRALNRERSNVGRGAYQDRVKSILLKCRSEKVAQALAEDLMRLPQGTNHDEITWLDVQEQAVRILATRGKTVFVSAHQLAIMGSTVQEARQDGYRIIFVPDRLVARLPNLRDLEGNPVLDLAAFIKTWNASFDFDFVDPAKLNRVEKDSWSILPELMRLAGDHAKRVREVRISNTMRLDEGQYETEGLWDSGMIVVKRSVLESRRHFARVVLHEIAHASWGANHGSIPFMAAIDDLAGLAAVEALSR